MRTARFLFTLVVSLSVLSACRLVMDIPDDPEKTCGDGTLDPGEECDGIDFGGKTCQHFGFSGGMLFCSSCTIQTTACESSGSCGDGTLDPGEECDGIDFGGQTCETLGYYGGTLACNADCSFLLTPCEWAGRCGDDVVQTSHGEECDGADLHGTTCQDLGYYGGILACKSDCTLDKALCAAAGRCGDGIVQTSHGEQCDDGNTISGDGCNASCTVETGFSCAGQPSICTPVCNDGLIRGTERCDDGNTISGDGCNASCAVETGFSCMGEPSVCLTICGDGLIRGTEQCDGTNLNGQTCQNLGYYAGALACKSDCTFDLSSCTAAGRCGDGVVQTSHGEECDGANLNGQACLDLGYCGGTLACKSDCTYDKSGCSSGEMCK